MIKPYFLLYPGIGVYTNFKTIVTAVSLVSAFILMLLAAQCLHLKLRRRPGGLYELVRMKILQFIFRYRLT